MKPQDFQTANSVGDLVCSRRQFLPQFGPRWTSWRGGEIVSSFLIVSGPIKEPKHLFFTHGGASRAPVGKA
jgi:hypothetical protein